MARSSPRVSMPFPNAPKSRVRRRPRVRSEWMTFRAATIEECAVTALDRRGSNSLTTRLLSRLLSSILGRYPYLARRNHWGVPTLAYGGASETAPPSGSARRRLYRPPAACTPRASSPGQRRAPRALRGRHGLPSCVVRTRRILERRGCPGGG